ncbi:MAG: cell division protein FtsZ [Chloroflexi bacterium]|nr:cell division protein FtsZ [Chloroflexota bacterium]
MVETVAGPTRRPRVKDAPAAITVIGVGGGGVNAVKRMMHSRAVPGVKYICVNTDVKSLESVQGAQVIHIGERLTRGLGAGGKPEVGEQAADTGRNALKQAIHRSDLVFLAAGMGGGTGTGAAPVVADVAKQSGALVVCVVTTPFSFEGARRLETAHAGIARLKEKVDNLIVIHNDRLLKLFKKDVPIEQALQMADEAVMYGVLSVAELVNVPGEINVDLADVKNIMHLPGHALMAMGEGRGAGGVVEAARQAVSNPLLDLSIDGAKGILFNVNGGPSLTLGEVNATGEFISSKVDRDAIIFFGMVNDSKMEDKARITIIATGIPDQRPKPAPQASAWESSTKK